MKRLTALCLSATLAWAGMTLAEEHYRPSAPDGLRQGGTVAETLPAPPMAGESRESGREVLNYPEQPPVVPHNIRDYQVDLRHNQCLTCHSRENAVRAGAPMVSVTHFMDRHKQVLAAVSPDRYFCTQCHVPQTDAAPLVENRFQTVDQVLGEMLRDSQGGEP
ncbi:nitrate reductase cytochrome c-type subunit [Franzmannia qiaohouensis]|uniref:Periplasmic nitrate reductase, electron transfer subunit n=1 Tax=Franzmannia qiaohouensis TaxID=1329370 RepID=A0ABU1HD12_9GAMM|nr:nitrate reductase cytochrome c-type subunit [Halomonas qiaohouensis]MDR5905356.1 nitrate reductase cytochrome c-type subunit [Halomonas qiaohouensis]